MRLFFQVLQGDNKIATADVVLFRCNTGTQINGNDWHMRVVGE